MAYRCDLCGKGKNVINKKTHRPGVAGGQWKKKAPKTKHVQRPNLQIYRGMLEGVKGKWRLCAKCLKKIRKKEKNNLNGVANNISAK